MKEKDVKVVLDTDEEALRRGSNVGPYLIKPNIHEFNRLVGTNVNTIEKIIEYEKPYEDRIQYIVVSMGVRGVIGISKEGHYRVTPPKIKVHCSVGTGDSLVAGIIFAFGEGHSFNEALMLGVACGTATALNPGNNLCTKNEIEIIKKDVLIEKI